jgi:hypothetical protein
VSTWAPTAIAFGTLALALVMLAVKYAYDYGRLTQRMLAVEQSSALGVDMRTQMATISANMVALAAVVADLKSDTRSALHEISTAITKQAGA